MHGVLSKVWVHKRHSKRLFLAIPLSSDWQETLSGYQKVAIDHRLTGRIPTNWTKPTNFHITVRFIGTVEESCIPFLIHELREWTSTVRPFSLPFQRMEIATPKDPKMIWARFATTREFRAIVRQSTVRVSDFLKKKCGGAVLYNGHTVIPHVTLARMKGIALNTGTIHKLTHTPPLFSVKSLILNASKTLPWGSEYTTLATFHLTEKGR